MYVYFSCIEIRGRQAKPGAKVQICATFPVVMSEKSTITIRFIVALTVNGCGEKKERVSCICKVTAENYNARSSKRQILLGVFP